MKKIEFNNLDQEMYYFKHQSGLDVYVVPFLNKKNFYAILGCKYGSKDVEFTFNKKEYKKPYGIAHFLEHKIFEQESGLDPFAFFAKSGVSANASTTFDNTRYYVWGVNEPYDNIDYLLNFVYSPYFTDENVLKEEGIIKEEILMYEDDPEWALDDNMRKNLFYELPVREKIAGTVDSILDITKEDLYDVYKAFYNPSNMYLIVGGNVSKDIIYERITNHKILNSFKEKTKIKRKEYLEPNDVKEEFKELFMNVTIPKIRYSVKINKEKFEDYSDIEINMYMGIIMSVLFGSTSDFKEKVMSENLTTGFYVEKNRYDKFLTLDITAESNKADIFIDEINKTLENIVIKKADFERIKKIWIASEIRMIDNIELTVDNIYSDLIMYGKVYNNRIELIKKLNMKKLNKFIENLNLTNKSLVMILPNKEKDN